MGIHFPPSDLLLSPALVPPRDAEASPSLRRAERPEERILENFPSGTPRADRGDSLDLRGADVRYLELSFRFHMERSILDQAGGQIGVETLDLQVEYRRLEVRFGNLDEEPPAEPAENEEPEESEPPSLLDRLMEYFNPENTSRRIFDFLRRGFDRTSFGEQDHPDSRRAFMDFILPFVREGVDSALEMFGELPEDVTDRAEETYDRTRGLLEAFVSGQTE